MSQQTSQHVIDPSTQKNLRLPTHSGGGCGHTPSVEPADGHTHRSKGWPSTVDRLLGAGEEHILRGRHAQGLNPVLGRVLGDDGARRPVFFRVVLRRTERGVGDLGPFWRCW